MSNTPFAFQTQSGASSTSNFTMSTPFEKLPNEVQKSLASIQQKISDNRKISEQLKSILGELEKSGKGTSDAGYGYKEIQKDLDLLVDKVRTVALCIDTYKSEGDEINQQLQLLVHYAESASVIAKDIDQLQKQPTSRYQDYAETPSPYFCDLLNSIQERMQQFRQILTNIEATLVAPPQSRALTPQMLADAAKNQHLAFMLSALQAGEIHNKVEELKTKYLALRKQQGDNIDPFEKAQKKKQLAFQPQQLMAMAQMQQQTQPQQPQQSQQTTWSFGAGSAPSTGGFGFGFGSTAASTSTFGSSSSGTGGFSFGSTPSGQSTGFSFGGGGGAPTGFSFGGASSAAPSTSFTFGSSAPATSAAFSFGGSSNTGGGFSFGGSTGGGGFTFGGAR